LDGRRRGRLGSHGRWLLIAAAVLSLVAAAIHLSVVSEHLQEWFAAGVFFLILTVLEVGWAAAVVARPSGWLLRVGVILNAATIAIWVLSRSRGMPIGPSPWTPEAMQARDILCTVAEALLVAACLIVLRTGFGTAGRPSRAADRATTERARERSRTPVSALTG
jgi:hypothetical protein